MSRTLQALIVADAIQIGLFALLFSKMPQQIPLFYSRPWGEDQITDFWYIALLPILMHLIYFLNFFISKKFFYNREIFQKIFTVANYCVVVAFTLIFIRIMLLVT